MCAFVYVCAFVCVWWRGPRRCVCMCHPAHGKSPTDCSCLPLYCVLVAYLAYVSSLPNPSSLLATTHCHRLPACALSSPDDRRRRRRQTVPTVVMMKDDDTLRKKIEPTNNIDASALVPETKQFLDGYREGASVEWGSSWFDHNIRTDNLNVHRVGWPTR
eukprot:GHVU01196750.1.p1 GENE.GHVU01196750.1~~GHVU01196750.1.p1  ORF type:complete len:160 (+),score=19.35 GHVU01196750.1:667-1146(+)